MSRHLPATPPRGAHEYTFRVYFEDTDAAGIVYHANYLRYAERARTEALRAAGLPHSALVADFGLIFVVRRARMEYLRPARLDDLVTVLTETLAVGGATATLRQSFRLGGAGIAVLEIELACARVGDGRPARIPPRWRTHLAAELRGDGSGSGG